MEGNHDLLIAKIVSGVGLLVASVICGVIPFKLTKIFNWSEPLDMHGKKKSNTTVNVLLCFGGGVLLATTFLHLLPDINYTITWLVETNLLPHMNLPLGELLMMVGFFLIYLIEELVHHYLHRHQDKRNELKAKKKNIEQSANGDAFERGNGAAISKFTEPQLDHQNSVSDLISVDHAAAPEKHHSGHIHGHSHLPIPHDDDEDVLVSSMRGLLIVLALSIHELFEGFAVGLQMSTRGVYFMFAAVSAHKFVIAFCIGVELMVQRTKMRLAFIYVLIYSAVSGIGKWRS